MINKIIPTFPENERAGLIEAANTWRLPYWDFAALKRREDKLENYELPLIATKEKITVTRHDQKPPGDPEPCVRISDGISTVGPEESKAQT